MSDGAGGNRGLSRRQFAQGALGGAAVAAGGMLGATGTAAARGRGRPGKGGGPAGHGRAGGGLTDIALVNGRFPTVGRHGRGVSAIVIRGGRIVELGRHPHGLPAGTRKIDLRGATVIPGLIDSHCHFVRACLNPGHEARGVEAATSIGELQEAIALRSRTVPAGEFITCIGGWNRDGLAERRLPTLAELDDAAPRHPVYLSETGGGRAAVTNGPGRAFFVSRGVTVDATAGTLSAGDGRAALIAAQTDDDKRRGIVEGMAQAAGFGLTMIHDMGGTPFESYAFPDALWRQDGRLDVRLRTFFNTNDSATLDGMKGRILNNYNRIGDDWFRLVGVGERLTSTGAFFAEGCEFAAAHGWTLTQHSLSAAENSEHVAAFKATAADFPIGEMRWSLAHLNSVTDAELADLAAIGVGVNLQGWRYTSSSGGGPPFRRILDLGIPAGGGTDATNVAPLDPWLMLYYMVSGRNNAGTLVNGGQTISRHEALQLYTGGSAYLSFDDGQLGAIEMGKLADLVVLSDDYFKVPEDRIRKLSSVLTLQAGRVVHASGRFAKLAG